jgi:hypothetical protein
MKYIEDWKQDPAENIRKICTDRGELQHNLMLVQDYLQKNEPNARDLLDSMNSIRIQIRAYRQKCKQALGQTSPPLPMNYATDASRRPTLTDLTENSHQTFVPMPVYDKVYARR